MFWGLSKLKPKEWTSTYHPDGEDWTLLISWQLWLYSGFIGLGSLAGEVDDVKVCGAYGI